MSFFLKNYLPHSASVVKHAIITVAFLFFAQNVMANTCSICFAGELQCNDTYPGGGTAECVSVYQAPTNGDTPTLINSKFVGYQGACNGGWTNGDTCCDSNGCSHDIQGCVCECNSSESSEWVNCSY